MQAGIILCGILIGVETTQTQDGTVKTHAGVAVGMQSYKVSIKNEEVIKVGGLALFEPVQISARPFVSNGRLYWTDGVVVSGGDG